MRVRVLSFRDKPDPTVPLVNTTSRSKDFGRGLSPFYLGPVEVPLRGKALLVENAWQYSKVYPEHVKEDLSITDDWFVWSWKGYRLNRAVRYPMGKGAVPLFSYWAGATLPYVQARCEVYFNIYRDAVMKTAAWKELGAFSDVQLLDFDGYDHDALGKSLYEVFMDPDKKAGHAFVLKAMLLHGEDVTIEDLKHAD